MNQKDELLLRSRAALEVPETVSFIQSLKALAPENMPRLAKLLRDLSGKGQVWEKSIIDLARLARDFPQEFLGAIKEIAMKRIRRVALRSKFIENGLTVGVEIEGLGCVLQLKPIGFDQSTPFNDLLGAKIEQGNDSCETFKPWFNIQLFLPPLSKDELLRVVQSFGPNRFPEYRMSEIKIGGHKVSVHHEFAIVEDPRSEFRHWWQCGYLENRTFDWENELNSFCMIVRFMIWIDFNQKENWTIPDFIKPRDFRLKIVLHCLKEYFGFEVEM